MSENELYYKHASGLIWHIKRKETSNKHTGYYTFRMYCGLLYYDAYEVLEFRGEDSIGQRRICKKCTRNKSGKRHQQ